MLRTKFKPATIIIAQWPYFPQYGWTPLIEAAQRNQVDAIQILLQAGANKYVRVDVDVDVDEQIIRVRL